MGYLVLVNLRSIFEVYKYTPEALYKQKTKTCALIIVISVIKTKGSTE